MTQSGKQTIKINKKQSTKQQIRAAVELISRGEVRSPKANLILTK